ncbi:hypothetical protein [Oceanispirochaeta sp.]|jgi:hypothetical protein|nr:hypothetical protein [Oceanispirochaeta sp.]MDA3958385.1 hypothetical protein [Oceanispirochaeta sp.]
MVVQINIKGELEKKILEHMKLYSHLSKKAYFIEMARRQAERDERGGD